MLDFDVISRCSSVRYDRFAVAPGSVERVQNSDSDTWPVDYPWRLGYR